jgi:hypothetical protein
VPLTAADRPSSGALGHGWVCGQIKGGSELWPSYASCGDGPIASALPARFPSRRAAMSEKPCQREQPRRHRGVGAHAAPRRRDSRAETASPGRQRSACSSGVCEPTGIVVADHDVDVEGGIKVERLQGPIVANGDLLQHSPSLPKPFGRRRCQGTQTATSCQPGRGSRACVAPSWQLPSARSSVRSLDQHCFVPVRDSESVVGWLPSTPGLGDRRATGLRINRERSGLPRAPSRSSLVPWAGRR